MEINNLGIIKKATIPNGWQEVPDTSSYAAMPISWSRIFSPPQEPNIEICFFYSGNTVDEQASIFFRKLLASRPEIVYAASNLAENMPAAIAKMRKLQSILGNAGNNQVVNQKTGYAGPVFYLTKAETQELNGKMVLAVYGKFIDEQQKPLHSFQGIFMDSQPSEKLCLVQEIYLKIPYDERVTEQATSHLAVFQEVLSSVQWI